MKRTIPLATLAIVLALSGCGEAEPTPDADANEAGADTTEGDSARAITPAALSQAKTQCEIAAVAQGGTAEQAKPLCDCVIERVAEGKSVAEFAAVSDEEANAVLEQCAEENGMSDEI
ncbi:MAG: hypothetical protein CL808_03540 [Citromicrobium sp.]|nr:hypothetical protein [Citromicrobium sp.]